MNYCYIITLLVSDDVLNSGVSLAITMFLSSSDNNPHLTRSDTSSYGVSSIIQSN